MSDLVWRLRSAAESAAWEATTPGLYGQLLKEAADALESRAYVQREGWKLVPVEPTPEMLAAGCNALADLYRGDGGWIGLKAQQEQTLRAWRPMIEAAPSSSCESQRSG